MPMTEILEDYYDLLGVAMEADLAVIKAAFRKKAHFWHPDRNSSADATRVMRQLIVAVKILSDSEARRHYDVEYMKWVKSIEKSAKAFEATDESLRPKNSEHTKGDEHKKASFFCVDPILSRWVKAANLAANQELMQFLRDFKDASLVAVEGAVKGVKLAVVFWIVFSLLLFLFLLATSR